MSLCPALTASAYMTSFFNNQQSYTSKQENKLRFWQSLCIVVSPS